MNSYPVISTFRKDQLIQCLQKLHIRSTGKKEQLKHRLAAHCSKQDLNPVDLLKTNSQSDTAYNRFFDYLVVVDFECTCEEGQPGYPHEIIEFPAVLVDLEDLKMVDVFHMFCKPVLNKRLTSFCKSLTGITQALVDQSEEFPAVLDRFWAWMESHGLGSQYHYAFLCDGPWDLGKFLPLQCHLSDIPLPHVVRYWVSLRKLYRNFYHRRDAKLVGMLQGLGMTFEGREHSGLDDAKNIARVAIRMLLDGCQLRINERVRHKKPPGGKPVKHQDHDPEDRRDKNHEPDTSKTAFPTENKFQSIDAGQSSEGLGRLPSSKLSSEDSTTSGDEKEESDLTDSETESTSRTSRTKSANCKSNSTDKMAQESDILDPDDDESELADCQLPEQSNTKLDLSGWRTYKKNRRKWGSRNQFKVVTVTRQEFMVDAYLECDTCDEGADDDDST